MENTTDNQVPVYNLEEVVAQSEEHLAQIKSIQQEVGKTYNNLDFPEPFILTVRS